MPIDRAAAAAVLSTQKASDILGTATRSSLALSTFPQIQMAKNVFEQVIAGARPTAGFVIEAETGTGPGGGVKPVSSFGFTNKTMTTAEVACIITVFDNVLADADIDLAAYMEPLVAEAIGIAVDEAVFYGVNAPGTWPDANIVGKAIAAGNRVQNRKTAGANAALEPVVNLDLAEQFNQALGAVEADNFNPSDVFAINSLRTRFRGLRDSSGAPVYLAEYRGDGNTEQIYGKPLQYLTGPMAKPATAEALVLDRSQFLVGIRQDIQVTASNEATIGNVSMFQTDQTAFRFTFRMAFASVVPLSGTVYPAAVIQPTLP